MIHHWYITVAAVREYLAICGENPRDDGDTFDRAAKDLAEICEHARLVKTEPHRETYRVSVTDDATGATKRLELTVSTMPRPEGPLPQLVRVRDKGRRGKRSDRR